MKKRGILLLSSVLIILLLTGACASREDEQPAEAQSGESGRIESVDTFGTVKAREVINVFLPFTALIKEIRVAEGQVVAQGEILAVLDLSDLHAEVQRAETALAKARSALARMDGEAEDGENPGYLERQKLLYETGAISRQAYTEAKWDYEMKLQDLRLQELELKRLLNKLELNCLDGETVISPLDKGIVFEIGYQKGDLINGEKKLLSLYGLEFLYVEADVNEEFIRDVQVGAKAQIIPLADPARSYEGKVTGIAAMAVKKNGETIVPVEIAVEDNEGFLRPNYNVDVKISRE